MKNDRDWARIARAGIAACVLTLCAVPAFAAAPRVEASLPSDDPAKVNAAREFIVTAHPKLDMRTVTAQVDKMVPQMAAGAKARNPKTDVKKYEADMRARMIDRAQKSLDEQTHIVSRHFTLQELQQLTAFYKTPLGQKLVAETAKIQMEMRAIHREERDAEVAKFDAAQDKKEKEEALAKKHHKKK